MSVRERLIGAWELVTFESRLPDGRTVSAMGRRATGHIVYSDNGLVSVNLSRAGRVPEEKDTLFHDRSDAAVAEIARGYMAYSGRFEVNEERSVARHHFDLCLDPALIGTLQERHVRFFDDKLELSVPDAGVEGVGFPSTLVWRRL